MMGEQMKENKTSGIIIKIFLIVFIVLILGFFLLIMLSDDDMLRYAPVPADVNSLKVP